VSQVVLITGASSGIGWETARLLARKGHKLALAARREARLQELARTLKEESGADALVLKTDMSRPDDVRAAVVAAHKHFGRLDVLVNNAGALFMGPGLTLDEAEMRTLMDVNFWGPLHAVRAAAPLMAAAGVGHVVNVGSGVSRRGLPFMAAYTATKFALTGLTESLRLELGPQKISFTMVYPGGVDTEMPRNVSRARLPAGYPDHSRSRISAVRAARAVVKAVECRPLEVYVPWWVRPAAWISTVCPPLADFLIRRRQKL